MANWVSHRWPIGAIGRMVFAALLLCAGQASAADINETKAFDIKPQSMDQALIDFSKQAGFQVVADSANVAKFQTRGVSGTRPIKAALDELLAGSGLSYRVIGPDVITIEKRDGSTPQASSLDKKTDAVQLEGIVVTAQKRSELLLDVPVPVTSIRADTLVDSNLLRLQDYYTRVPGLSVTPGDFHGSPMLSIRGVTTGGGFLNPTVGIVVDDVPYGSSTGTGGGFQAPDIDPSDLANIEVLRGPQGTLYGASSIGGLLKFLTVDPSTDGVSGRVQAGISGVHNGNGLGYSARGAVNVPLSNTLAVRASGFTRGDPGYVDDPAQHLKGVNKGDADGGRLSALWRPSDAFFIKLSALLQQAKLHGSPNVDVKPGLEDLQHTDLPGTGEYSTKFQAYSATLNAKLGSVDLTSVSGYTVNWYSDAVDFTPALAAATRARFGVTGTPLHDENKTKKFTQEVRLSAPIGQRVELLLGGFYTHEDSQLVQDILVADDTGTVINQWSHSAPLTTFAEYAVFADVTFRVTDRFDVQIGGRESKNRQVFNNTFTGPYVTAFAHLPTDPFVYPEIITKENSFTYLVTPRFKVSPDLMVYARLASGYRPGGPNSTAAVFGTPPSFKPDKTQNYEIGFKGSVLDHALSFDASLYHIDWKDIQLNLTDPVSRIGYRSNASRAKSQGVELSVEARPLSGLTIAGWVAYGNALLTESLPRISNAYGIPGDRLPYSSRLSGNFSVDQKFPLTSDVIGFVGGSVSYVGDRKGVFRAVPQRQTFPAYIQVDLRTGVKYDLWTVNAFITNVADKRGVLTGGLGTSPYPLAFNYIQPRTVGLSLAKSF